MLLYLARHAQTASSKVDSYNGRADLPLTDHGRAQAAALGKRLSTVEFAAVYRSPLSRTAATASLIAPAISQHIDPDLTEIDYGEWEGLSPGQARARDPQAFADWLADPVQHAPPGGETIAQVAGRALAAVHRVALLHQDEPRPILAVSHKATLRALGAALVNAELAGYRTRWAMDECALSLVELRPDKEPFLRLWNDTAHLGDDPAATTRGGH